MAYIGNTPASNFASVTKDTFSGDGSETQFTLSKTATTNGVAVFVENVRQEPTTAYAVSGTTLTFTAAPVSSSGNNIYVLHHNTPASTATHPSAQALTATSGTFSAGVSGTTGTFTGTVTAGSTLDMNGTELILDADGDTSITSDTDDEIDFKTAGTDRFLIDSSGFLRQRFTSDNSTTAEGFFINNMQNSTGNNASLIFSNDSGGRKKAAIAHIDTGSYGAGDLVFALDGADSGAVHLTNDEKMRILSDGKVGIGISNPGNGLDVLSNISGGYAAFFHNDGDSNGHYGLRVAGGRDDGSTTNVIISICDGDNEAQGHISIAGSTVSYGAFTAHHEISLPDSDNANGYAYGTLLDIDKIYYTQKDGKDSERGIRYLVKKTQSAYSRKILGAYSSDMFQQADKDGDYKDNLHQAGVLGDGHVICNGEKGNIVVGDGICSSSTAGVGMKADKMAMIIGIAQEDVTFSSTSETKLVPVQYGVRQFTAWTD